MMTATKAVLLDAGGRPIPSRPPAIIPAAAKDQLPTAAADAKNMLLVIAKAAADPAVNPDKMRALLDLQKEIMAEEARRSFVRAFRALQTQMPIINRDGKIEVRAKDAKGERTGKILQSTPFSTYQNIMKVLKPLLNEHGFVFGSAVEPTADGTRIMVVSYLDHDDGHQRSSRFPLPAETSGSKNNIQGWGSSQSYGTRYNAIALLNIISEAPQDQDRDGHPQPTLSERKKGDAKPEADGEPVDVITDEQFAELNRKMIACKVPLEKVLKAYGIDKLEQLPADRYDDAIRSCDTYKKRLDEAGSRG